MERRQFGEDAPGLRLGVDRLVDGVLVPVQDQPDAGPRRLDLSATTSSISGAPRLAPAPPSAISIGQREQVRIEPLSDRAADPDEITGEVLRPELAPEGRPRIAEPEAAAGDAETVDRATGKPLPRTVPRTLTSDWDDLLIESRSEGAFAALADRGLTETTIPWGSIGIVLAASAVVGVLASLWPAHRAAKTDPLEAISD